jgi:hypothetical protein
VLKRGDRNGPKVPTGRPHVARFLGHVGHARSALVAPLPPSKILVVHFPSPFGIQKVLKHQKYGEKEFSDSHKLNTKNGDFVRKSHILSKTCKNNNKTMQITI